MFYVREFNEQLEIFQCKIHFRQFGGNLRLVWVLHEGLVHSNLGSS